MGKTYIIAEIGINHNGDINLAKELINQASQDGCDAVKFQKRDVDLVYSVEELDIPRESPFGTTTRQQKEGIEFSIEEYKELESYSKSKGLDFIVSCWDLHSLDSVESNLNVKYHKIASAMLTDKTFLERLNGTGRPIIVSTGLSTEEEVDKALDILDNVEYVLACTSTYPTLSEEVNLKYVSTLKEKYPHLKNVIPIAPDVSYRNNKRRVGFPFKLYFGLTIAKSEGTQQKKSIGHLGKTEYAGTIILPTSSFLDKLG